MKLNVYALKDKFHQFIIIGFASYTLLVSNSEVWKTERRKIYKRGQDSVTNYDEGFWSFSSGAKCTKAGQIKPWLMRNSKDVLPQLVAKLVNIFLHILLRSIVILVSEVLKETEM